MQRRNAFTLIELLVVIAIIAILAAILFPVFAQAKQAAKKASAIAQTKQTGTAMLLYTGDSDDQFPCGLAPDLTYTAGIKYRTAAANVLTPAGWDGNATLAASDQLVWSNSIQPYAKNYDMYNLPGTNVFGTASPAAGVSIKPVTVTFAYNGLLQYLSTTSITAPSQLPMFWPGYGNAGTAGTTVLSPRLNCNSTGPCMYNPSGPPQTGATGNPQIFTFSYTPSFYVYAKGAIHVYTDSSAKLVPYGTGNQASYPASTNSAIVWQYIDGNTGSIPTSPGAFYRGMGGLRGANYAAAFCPDNSFSN